MKIFHHLLLTPLDLQSSRSSSSNSSSVLPDEPSLLLEDGTLELASSARVWSSFAFSHKFLEIQILTLINSDFFKKDNTKL